MTSTLSSKKLPINISIYSNLLNDDILKDPRVIQLLNIAHSQDSLHKYQYAFYSDSNELKSNIFMPVFHTMYLACSSNNVIIKGQEDFWLLEAFSNNRYFILKENTEPTTDYAAKNIQIIDSITDMEKIYAL